MACFIWSILHCCFFVCMFSLFKVSKFSENLLYQIASIISLIDLDVFDSITIPPLIKTTVPQAMPSHWLLYVQALMVFWEMLLKWPDLCGSVHFGLLRGVVKWKAFHSHFFWFLHIPHCPSLKLFSNSLVNSSPKVSAVSNDMGDC